MREKIRINPAVRTSPVDSDTVGHFTATIASVAVHLDEIRHFRAKTLGISGPQFAILLAIKRLDEGEGVSVRHVARALHVDSSFITTQSKLLEKKAMVRRRVDGSDARVVNLSLSDKASKQIAGLADDEQELNEFIFSDIGSAALRQLTAQLDHLEQRLEKACRKIAGGF